MDTSSYDPFAGIDLGLSPSPSVASMSTGRTPWGPVGGFRPWSAFRPADLLACYPMPAWVADRIRSFPQAAVGNALHDPLPLPFTPAEVRQALLDVWLASRQRPDRRCADIDPASVRIAVMVLEVLLRRNQGWIDFGSRSGPADLRCLLYRLVGKPLPPVHDFCRPPAPRVRGYDVNRVQTTFDPNVVGPPRPPGGSGPLAYLPATVPDGPGGERPRGPRPAVTGSTFERVPFPVPDPFIHGVLRLVSVHDIKE